MTTEATPAGWVATDDTFGARLALVRQRMGWNVKEAALACGLPPKNWANWESGLACRTLERDARIIADRVGCDYAWLALGLRPNSPDGGAAVSRCTEPTALVPRSRRVNLPPARPLRLAS